METTSENEEMVNRLGREKSPYLLQHAKNPVNWYPWGEEAFEKAKAEDKPLFISIGYSTCHWCHVMARESFEDREVAEELNRNFVPVKVDREERPDVDHVYMEVCRMLTGSGGWPLTIIATPDKKPFFAGTYFPKESKFGLPGLLNILQVVSEGWATDKDRLIRQAERVSNALAEENKRGWSGATGGERAGETAVKAAVDGKLVEILDRAFSSYSGAFDEEYGGFGTAPKFPSPHNLMFLLRYWKRTGQRRALDMAEKTIRRAYAGGIYDHVGFGFFRYSTDSRWMIPHFEKMLYDNALMLMAVTELWLCTKKDAYRQMASEIASFIWEEMTSPEGGFYAAIDAESEGEEGKYYVWTYEDLEQALGKQDAPFAAKRYGIKEQGPFRGFSIPHLPSDNLIGPRDPSAERFRKGMKAFRASRVRPATDDKILTSWNSLMIAAFAKAYGAFKDKEYLRSAEEAYGFITRHLLKDGVLYARYRDGEVLHKGYLDDYAFFVWALLEFYQATFEERYLSLAKTLAEDMVEIFWDEERAGFFLTGKDSEELIIRPKEAYDGAVPSGNSVAVMDLLRLSHLLGLERFEELGMAAIAAMEEMLTESPAAFGLMLSALSYSEGARDITVTGRHKDPAVEPMLNYIRSLFLPESQVIFAQDRARVLGDEPEDPPSTPSIVICQGRICGQPITNLQQLQRALMTAR